MNESSKLELSVIIPVYNAEQYLRACLDSVLSQTFIDWELILVDDGSDDNSGLICDEYASKDSRIKVIHKSNGGAAAARNAALDIAGGSYITFLDSDDEFGTKTTLKENMSVLKANPSIDFLQFPYVYIDNNGRKRFSATRTILLTSKKDVLNFMLDDRIPGYLCSKIFRAELFDGMRFSTDITVTEDMSLLIDFLERVDTVYVSESGLYSYYRREGSLTVSKTKEKEMQCSYTYRKLLSVTGGRYGTVDEVALARRFFSTLSHLLTVYALYGGDNLEKDLNELLPYMPDWKLLFGKLKVKYKLKILQIKILGYRRFAKLNIYSKRRKLK